MAQERFRGTYPETKKTVKFRGPPGREFPCSVCDVFVISTERLFLLENPIRYKFKGLFFEYERTSVILAVDAPAASDNDHAGNVQKLVASY